jgi:hypothetical protein
MSTRERVRKLLDFTLLRSYIAKTIGLFVSIGIHTQVEILRPRELSQNYSKGFTVFTHALVGS